jgi:hypothetical protein
MISNMLQGLINKKIVAFLILGSILITFSCNKNDDTINPLDPDIQIINEETEVLDYSEPPFNLNAIQSSFSENIVYGPYDKNIFDIFIPDSEEPTSLVIFLHGGGFLGGDKSYFYTTQQNDAWDFPSEISNLLENNIAVANINYRVLQENDDDGIIKPLSDCKRALQFIRNKAALLNIDKENIVLYGVSAGAGASLWLNFHDDMADTSNSDEVLQESTRVSATVALETQATYDLVIWAPRIFSEYNITFEKLLQLDENRVFSFYGVNTLEEIYSPEIEAYRNEVDMLGHISNDDPSYWASNIIRPVTLPNTVGLVTHHAYHVQELKNIADIENVTNVSYYGNPLIYEDTSEETAVDFIVRKLNE